MQVGCCPPLEAVELMVFSGCFLRLASGTTLPARLFFWRVAAVC